VFQQITIYFWAFLDDQEGAGNPITQLGQIDGKTIKDYLAWLETRIVSVGRRKGQPLSISAKKNAYATLRNP